MAFKLKSPFNAYMDDADTSKLKQVQHSSSYTGPKNMITADGVNTQLTQDDKITTVGGDDPFSGYSKDTFKKKNGDDTPVPTDAEMKNTFDQFLFDNKEELDKLDQDAKDAQKRKQPLYPSQQVQKRTTTSMRNPKDQLVDIDKYRKSPVKMKKKQLTKTGAGKAHNMSALQYNQEQLMSNLSGAGDQPSKEDLDAMKALLSMQNNQGMQGSPMNQNGNPKKIKMETIPPQNPGVYKSTDLKSPDNMSDSDEMFWRKTAHRVADDRPVDKEGKSTRGHGISGGAFADLMHLERHGQTDRLMGTLATPTEKIKKGYKKGMDDYLAKPGGSGKSTKSNKYIKPIKQSPANNKDLRKMKRAAIKEDKARIKAKRKAGTLDSGDFANEPYRTIKGKF